MRMCVDYREPNKAVVMDSHPLPHMDDIFTEMRGATVFSTIDLANAYHQVLLAEESRDITAFITHEGLFRFSQFHCLMARGRRWESTLLGHLSLQPRTAAMQ